MGDTTWSSFTVSLARCIGLCAVALSLNACSGCDSAPKPGDGLFATRCDEDKDCESLICAGLDGETKLCTESCTDPLGDECESGFRCRRPDREEGLVCVCTDPGGCEGDVPGGDCTFASECDDGVDCTDDRCDENECSHVVQPFLCSAGSSCDAYDGCVENPPCSEDFECSTDGDDCRFNGRCEPSAGRCEYDFIDSDGDSSFPIECGGDDCNDFDFTVNRGATEVCDGTDNDCDGVVDDGAEQVCNGACSFDGCGCSPPLTDCGSSSGFDSCVDLNNDPFNCGGCGAVCGGGLSCVGGFCTDQDLCFDPNICPPNSTCANASGRRECRCNAGFEPNAPSTECIDVDECNRGLHNCGSNNSCINLFGGFECLCPRGFQDLGFGCIDINECSNGFSCGNGFCSNTIGSFDCICNAGFAPDPMIRVCQLVDECQAGLLDDFRWCNGGCRHLPSDPDHCGSCNRTCFDRSFCDDGRCECESNSLTYCGTSCINTKNNAQHCGECNNRCPAGAACVNGDCSCPMGQVNCFGECVTLGTLDHCQSCNDACGVGASCTESGCACPASTPLVCDGYCVNPDEDEANCGECYRYCPENATCTAGECQCPDSAPDYCADFASCNDFATSEESCGSCGNFCEVICNEGDCTRAQRTALGTGFGCVLFDDARVGCFGSNDSGRLGRGLSTTLTSETIGLLPLSNIELIAARDGHACAIDAAGVLRCWGENSAQQLGNGDTADQSTPVMTRTGVAQVAVGLLHTCVVLGATGAVECVGSDALGQRGDGAASPAFGTWTGPAMLANVEQLVSGANHLCALIQGEVFCWGDNTSGQLGLGTSGAGTSLNAPGAKVTGLSNVTRIAAGQNHTCAVVGLNLQQAKVYCWGENSSSQCGTADTGDRPLPTLIAGLIGPRDVAAGNAHTCAIASNGELLCWGSGADRQNGRATTGPQLQALWGPWNNVAAGSAHTCGVSGGDFVCLGDGPSITNGLDTPTPTRIIR